MVCGSGRDFLRNGDPPGKSLWGCAETWLRMQVAYDLAQAEKRVGKIKVRRVNDALIST